jgi:hypothetical protein
MEFVVPDSRGLTKTIKAAVKLPFTAFLAIRNRGARWGFHINIFSNVAI